MLYSWIAKCKYHKLMPYNFSIVLAEGVDVLMENQKRAGRQTAESAKLSKGAIMEAAAALFASKGFDATSLRNIASQAGLSHGIIRHHFGSKLEIWLAIAESAFSRYSSEMLPVISEASQSENAFNAFVKVVRSFIRISMEQPELVNLLVREGGIETSRSNFIKQRFDLLHQQIAVLFNKAKKESAVLAKHSNDSFFLFLMSLVVFPVTLPIFVNTIPLADYQDNQQNELRERLIMNTLLGVD
jgi:AcrR family transcriptional regulator